MHSSADPAPRDQGRAVMELQVAIEYGELHEKLWSHLDTALSWVQVIGGALALAGGFAGSPALAATAGTVLALTSGTQISLRPRERAINFRDTRRQLEALHASAWGLPLQALDAEMSRLLADAPRGFDALTRPAQNRVLARHGHPTDPMDRRLSRWLAALAA